MTRELRIVATNQLVGLVQTSGQRFVDGAREQFREARERLGDDVAAQLLVDNGWSNGYLYFTEPTP